MAPGSWPGALLLLAGALLSALPGRPAAPANTPPGSVASPPGETETYRWQAVAIGGGGFITGLASDAAGQTLVARTDVHGAYRWDEAIGRWSLLTTVDAVPPADRGPAGMAEGVFEVAVAPSRSTRVYMATRGRVYRSDDAGRHWTRPEEPPWRFDANSAFRLYGPFLAVSPRDPDLVLFGTPGDGLWRSTDGGGSWTRAAIPAAQDLRPEAGVQAPGIPVWFGGDGTVWAAPAGHGPFVSRDDGASFAPDAGGPRTVATAATARDGTLYAIDPEAEQAWVRRKAWQPVALPKAAWAGVAVNPRDGSAWLSDAGGRLWCSADGMRWDMVARSLGPGPGDEPPWLRLTDSGYFASGRIGFDQAVPDRLWVAAGVGPFFADTGPGCPAAIRWQSRVRGIEEIVANDIVQPPGRAPLFAGWDFGIWQKRDLAAWPSSFLPRPRLLISAQQIDWSPSDPDFLVTNASDARMCCAEDGDAVLAGYSLDGGATWAKFATLPVPPGARDDDPWRMSFGSIAVAADDTRNIVWMPAFNRAPFYTLDRGRSWHRVVLPGEMGPLTGSFPNLHGSRKTLAADRVLPGTFYLVHSGEGRNPHLAGVWRSGNGGRSWAQVHAGAVAPGSQDFPKLRAMPGRAETLFYAPALDYGADTALRRSRDGGASWATVPGIDRIDDVAFGKAAPGREGGREGATIFVSARYRGRYGIWRSIDDAASWQQVASVPLGRLDRVTAMEADKDVFGRVYIGFMGSGWIWGEPAGCRAKPFAQGDTIECSHVLPR
jgi:hypothetical protein